LKVKIGPRDEPELYLLPELICLALFEVTVFEIDK